MTTTVKAGDGDTARGVSDFLILPQIADDGDCFDHDAFCYCT
ncbi:MAG TPA: hypothetical protein PL061_11960 [Syntrophales bacterium]|nr:hypothetical protein [Syntrophales bacterium]